MTDDIVERTPWWFVSVFIHAVLFAVAALIVAIARPPAGDEPIVVRPPQPVSCREFRPPEPLPSPEIFEKTDEVVEPFEQYRDHANESADLTAFQNDRGESRDAADDAAFEHHLNVGTVGVGGGGAGDRGNDIGGRVDRRGRPDVASPEAIEAVEDALRWLARHQDPDGSWRARGHLKQCRDGACTRHGVELVKETTVGLTGLSLLAFLGSGYTHRSREYGDTVLAAAQFLIAQQTEDGCVGPKLDEYMYGHAIATLALAEAFALTGSSKFRPAAQRAVDFLVAAQNPGLAWRYRSRSGDNDTSVTQWAVMALKAADMAGLRFPRESFDGALAFLDRVAYKKEEGTSTGGRRATGYMFGAPADVNIAGLNETFNQHPSTTAIGAMCRMFVRKQRDSNVTDAVSILMDDLPLWKSSTVDFYYWYCGSLALFQHTSGRGATWEHWNEALAGALLPNQVRGGCAAGSWEPVGRWCGVGGRVYATAINALTLEVYYRYSSVFGGR